MTYNHEERQVLPDRRSGAGCRSARSKSKAGNSCPAKLRSGFDAAGAAKGEYLLPIVAELPEGGAYVSKSDPMVRYIVIRVSTMDIDTEATALTGTKIEPAAGWTISCYQGTNSSGATGVWNCDTDEQKSKMFDGKLDEQCWYASSQSFSWGYGGNFIIGLDKTYDVSGFRWHYYYEDSNPQITDVRVQRRRKELDQPEQSGWRSFPKSPTNGRSSSSRRP